MPVRTDTHMLQHLPNTLTLLRLVLAVPLGFLILREEFGLALCIGLLAGLTDSLDGYFARRLDAFSRFGAALDPIADKTVITVCFLSAAAVELVPWYLAIVVVGRDLVIVCGAASYAALYGPFEFAATQLGKANMFVQISFCLLVLLAQVVSHVPPWLVPGGTVVVILLALASGVDYVVTWTIRAIQAGKDRR